MFVRFAAPVYGHQCHLAEFLDRAIRAESESIRNNFGETYEERERRRADSVDRCSRDFMCALVDKLVDKKVLTLEDVESILMKGLSMDVTLHESDSDGW